MTKKHRSVGSVERRKPLLILSTSAVSIAIFALLVLMGNHSREGGAELAMEHVGIQTGVTPPVAGESSPLSTPRATENVGIQTGVTPPVAGENSPLSTPTATEHVGIQTGITPDGYPYKGSPDAPVKIIEYSDYLCGHCRNFALNTAPMLENEYVATGKVQYIFHYYALGQAQVLLGEAAHCAADQGHFWEYHRIMFESQNRFASISSMEELLELLTDFAEQAGLDVPAFVSCWNSHQHQETIINAVLEARESGVGGTPTFSIQGDLVVGNQPYDVFQDKIEESLAEKGQ